MFATVLLVILVLALVSALPIWLYSANWGYSSSAGLGLLFVILIFLAFNGG